MVIRIHRPSKMADKNRGSVSNLVDYLEKENTGKGVDEHEEFFNKDDKNVTAAEVQMAIDNNKGKLSKEETKFYMLTVNPSKPELEHLRTKMDETTVSDERLLKMYVNDLMDEYAKNFNRTYEDGKPLTGDDILYYAKIEHDRTYKHGEKRFSKVMDYNKRIEKRVFQVKKEANQMNTPSRKEKKLKQVEKLEKDYVRNSEGTIIKEGALKDGNNLHVHIIVSRMDKKQTMKLSPMANHKQSQNELNGQKVDIGFNRDAFVASGEKLFDTKFEYDRPPEYQYTYYKEAKKIRSVSNLMHLTNPKAFAKTVVKKALNEMITDKSLQKQLGYVTKDPRKLPMKTIKKLEEKAIESVVKAMGAGAYTNPVTAGVQIAKQAISIAVKTVSKGVGI
ncbi:hypothetical protein HME9304_01787 [Flagellimonas maritima]|uniref:Mobilization protein n=1 Tax=Flagellimonas maritima TaxID=1383885 RepID=A0A2Z4LST0_9FLAO|nr:MobB family relaxase [Allomuricauda aurantiaca]AWX44782.1 hypothetical protein HME9304_01787 [Allomuricauda aurantiaca]